MKKNVSISKLNNTGQSAQKVRLVADSIRGKSAVTSSEILNFVNKLAARHVKKCLDSAIANASVAGFGKSNLFISKITVDEATTMKRMRPVSRGRGREILKRSSNIFIELSEK